VKKRSGFPQALSDTLDATLRGMGAAPDLVPLAVLRAWPAVVGPHAAQKTQPVRFARGRLTVHVTSEVWVTEILADSDALIARLHAAIGRRIVHALSVRVGDVVPAPPPAPPASKRAPAAVPAEIEALLRGVDDPELRESIRRAVGFSLGRKAR
jgi:hypothetical protein